jgi:pimeloyl-ACP methyl ester carboxylesterase
LKYFITFLFKRISLIPIAVFCAGHLSAGIQPPFVPGKVIDPVACAGDPTQSYALYIPKRGNGSPLPVVYFFDSHGVGALPLNRYKMLADAYGFILVGSNNSKNGNDWGTAEKIWGQLFDDTRRRLKIDAARIYTCGFSGGAKVASYVAIQHPVVKGVIANGAGLPDGVSASDLGFSFTAIAGEGDMNMTDLLGLNDELDKTRTRHRIILFDGKHEWAPVTVMSMAFAGEQFDAMLQSLIPRNGAFIAQYIADSKRRVEADQQSRRLIRAWRECQLTVSLLDGLTSEVSWFRERDAGLARDQEFRRQQEEETHLLSVEQQTKTEYMGHFQDGMPYWSKTIGDLEARAGTKTVASGMYQRLLAWLSLAFYSLSNRAIGSGQNAEARHFVDLYKLADPGNSEAWYFSAILHARDGDATGAQADLLKAVSDGFGDKARMMGQPEFQRLGGKMDLRGIEAKMH